MASDKVRAGAAPNAIGEKGHQGLSLHFPGNRRDFARPSKVFQYVNAHCIEIL